jgi:magnesium and cobalt transporter
MAVLERDAPRDELLKAIVESGHSRFPVIGDDREEVVGILLAKDVLRHFVDTPGEDFDISRYIRPATFIPESKRLNALLKEFRGSRNHIAIVVDEYGGITGLLTIEDVLEEIVGEIDDEHDAAEIAPIQEQDPGHYHVRALARIEEFNDFFDTDLDDENYDTVGGLVMHELGHLPRKGETLQFGEFHFQVLQADRRRVHSVEVTRGSSLPADGDVAAA